MVVDDAMPNLRAVAVLLLIGCASSPPAIPSQVQRVPEPLTIVPLGRAQQHFHTLPVRINGEVPTEAILDTGIGLALISRPLCERIGCEVNGEFTGQRMSGQAVTFPLTTLARLEIGSVARENVVAGVIDIEGFFPEPQIEAFVGLPFFERIPFTIDGPRGTLTLESDSTLTEREAVGQAFPIRLDRHGPALDVFVRMIIGPGEHAASAEMLMDTGSPGLTLHARYAQTLGIDLEDESIRRREGQDETGHTYARFFTTLDAPIGFVDAPTLHRTGLRTMFQEIIHDGLVGNEFLSSFVITYDLPRERVIVMDPNHG